MAASILAILAYLIPFLLDAWKENSPNRKEEKRYGEIQQGRQDIIDGNAVAIQSRIDRLLSVPENGKPICVVRGESEEDFQRRISAL